MCVSFSVLPTFMCILFPLLYYLLTTPYPPPSSSPSSLSLLPLPLPSPFLHNRDAFLCSILDGMRASFYHDECAKMHGTKRGQHLGPLYLPMDEKVDSQYLKYMVKLPQGVKLSELFLYQCWSDAYISVGAIPALVLE